MANDGVCPWIAVVGAVTTGGELAPRRISERKRASQNAESASQTLTRLGSQRFRLSKNRGKAQCLQRCRFWLKVNLLCLLLNGRLSDGI